MTFWTLIRRGLRFHWRAHLGVVLGAAVGSAALIGALVVGDSVKESLRERALEGIHPFRYVLAPPGRLFSENLMRLVAQHAGFAEQPITLTPAKQVQHNVSLLILPGIISRADGKARANAVQVIGVPEDFVGFSGGLTALNLVLNRHLQAQPGDEVILRVRKPTFLVGDSALAPREHGDAVMKLICIRPLSPDSFGNLNPRPNQSPPLNIFVRLDELQAALGLTNLVNVGLQPNSVSSHLNISWRFRNEWRFWLQRLFKTQKFWPNEIVLDHPESSSAKTIPFLQNVVRGFWGLQDIGVQLAIAPHAGVVELRSPRVFLEPPVVAALTNTAVLPAWLANLYGMTNPLNLPAFNNQNPILTYLANLLRAGTNATPYSMVTAAGSPLTPPDMRDDEILISQWLAEDLQVKPGDSIELSYFLPESGVALAEATNRFRVRAIVPMEMPWADRTLMPDFPGIEKAESTRDWDAGFPLVHKIRPQDEDYWKQYRGTPKAFVTLAAGQKMWGNRFGNLTAIRFPVPLEGAASSAPKLGTDGAVPSNVEAFRAALEKKILATLKPEELGLRFEPVREQALKAAEQSQDFGQLFLGFSIFLIAAALLLMAMLFQLGLEQRATEVGTLLALGFRPNQVRRLLLMEGAALSLLGGVIGALGGLAYARAMLHGLTTVWRDAVGASSLSFHVTAQTLVIGLLAGIIVCVVTIWLTLRKFVRRPARELLAGEVGSAKCEARSAKSVVMAVAALAAALGLVGWTVLRGDTANAGAFFGAGALLLIAGLSFVSAWLARRTGVTPVSNLAGSSKGDRRDAGFTLGSLGLRGCARRRKRSLATVAMLACGSFLIVAIGVFRLDANRDATKRSSGTGGFALIGETTMPIVQDLNSKAGRDFSALNASDLEGVSFVPCRVHDGDEASCLNLNRAQKPRLLGVKPELLEGRFTFATAAGWRALKSETRNPKSEIEVPAIGDANSIEWALGKKVGDTLDYTDERGRTFKLRLVGAVANSILQGSLIINEAEFVKRFPGESGYRMFLIDAPSNRATDVSATLSRALQDVGLELTPAARRLAQFNAVQNTYLGTFQILGGLGLLLGSVGLGIVVLRNVLERRGELALLLAVGFRPATLQRLLLVEHGALLGLGLALGMVAAAVAVLPALLAPGAQLPYASLALTLAAVLANGAAWTWAATRLALRGNLLAALRNE